MNISEMWSTLEMVEKIYWIFAIPSTFAFIILLAFTFIGGGVDTDMGEADADVDGDDGIGFQFFTLKNLVAFFTIFAWSGLASLDSGLSIGVTVIISVVCGIVMMLIMTSIFFMMGKLTDSGTMDIKNAIGNLGEVYLTIPANRDGFGKVQLNVQGSMRELRAMSDGEINLTQGMVVQVVDVIDDHILLVKKSS